MENTVYIAYNSGLLHMCVYVYECVYVCECVYVYECVYVCECLCCILYVYICKNRTQADSVVSDRNRFINFLSLVLQYE